ncbi:MAG: sigma-54-dependent Fis family transcriptional regulator [Phycisphaerae bacterium]|nr:sigma-54-dependent Fis family transcriptional regulator [Phycisphaerae bacterium]
MSPLAESLSPASLTALTEAAAAITSTLKLDSVLQTIARLACSVTRGEASCVFLLDARTRRVTVAAATGSRRDAFIGREFDSNLGIPGQVIRTGSPISIINASRDNRFVKQIDHLASLRTHSIIAAPMLHRGEMIGVVEVVNRLDGSDFSPNDLKILQVFATLAAGATQNARAYADLQLKYDGLRESVMKKTAIIGQSPLMQEVLKLCERVAPSNATALLLGQTGTGKELCARYIHSVSRRRHETFVAINCAALSETLLESELFGHEKGSFTDAHAQRRGWFEAANRGTLFLDEIGDISRATQVKLLRVLQEREFVRVGGSKPIPCDVRIIAATNRNLKNMMADGLFRDDLYYRLSVFPIRIPSLRERREDIPLLVEHFVKHSAEAFRVPAVRVSEPAMDLLTRYHWPGNIRELQNVIERSVLMADNQQLLPGHLPPDIQAAVAEVLVSEDVNSLQGQERALILKALTQCAWNQSKAARTLGISRDYLRHKIKKYGLRKPASPGDADGESCSFSESPVMGYAGGSGT